MAGAFELLNKRTIKQPINELDKSTVISIYPKTITEVKHTLNPGTFTIPAGSPEKPSFTVVGSSSWWRDMGENEPLLEIVNGSVIVADSIVKDWSNGILECNMDDKMPGWFFLPGEWNMGKLIAEKKPRLELAIKQQKNWFEALVKTADIWWAKSNGNPLSITDDMRLAAEMLNQKDRDWFRNVTYHDVSSCPACGQVNKLGLALCPNCKCILDAEKAKNLKFAS